MHPDADASPRTVEKLPEPHFEHSCAPLAAYVPAGHTVHASEVSERATEPGSHMTHDWTPGPAAAPLPHGRGGFAGDGQLWPEGQRLQVDVEVEPSASEYVPDGHMTHPAEPSATE